MLADFAARASSLPGTLLHFRDVGNRDVYNITAPFALNGEVLLAGRVEHRDNELSEIIFFRQDGQDWIPRYSSPDFAHLQDPCIAFVGGELILGGVRYPVNVPGFGATWIMEFYRGRTLGTLQKFLVGPGSMKDIRFCDLPGGRVGVFSRPQGPRGGRGTIGFAVADSLDAVDAASIDRAPLLEGQFAPGEWGGANEAHLLPDGSIGVLGHIAQWNASGDRHYYPMSFMLNPRTLATTTPTIIAERSCFPLAPAKRADLQDVVFSGGLVRHRDGGATLYAGLGDAAAGSVNIRDPFRAIV